jgi:hypothetical protein
LTAEFTLWALIVWIFISNENRPVRAEQVERQDSRTRDRRASVESRLIRKSNVKCDKLDRSGRSRINVIERNLPKNTKIRKGDISGF